MSLALRATSLTLAAFLEERLRADANLGSLFDPLSGGTLTVSLSSPQEMEENHQEGVSLWLYRVARNSELLNAPLERVTAREMRNPPLPMSLHYLATPRIPVGRGSAETEQAILGKILQELHDHPVLHGSDLRDDLIGSATYLHVHLEPLELEEIARVWDALDSSYQLSVSYEVSIVDIRSHIVESSSPVESVRTEVGLLAGIASSGA